MKPFDFVSPDLIRTLFARAMSELYKSEVPLYGTLLDLVREINDQVLANSPTLKTSLEQRGELERLDQERHGAIRLGTAEELHTMRRLFAVMGMFPVGYYDLSQAGVPVHATAFRATHEDSLQKSPFRVFTSLLRLELIADEDIRALCKSVLSARRIFSPRVLELIEKFESDNGLNVEDATEFVKEALKTFSWHTEATVTEDQYQRLHQQHRLIADIVAFKGPHINHLTPRTLDIDAVQRCMPDCGIAPKAVIEGPPRRECPILLRQTSFKALEEKVYFIDQTEAPGKHTARFGEIEQRGVALTPRGRAMYDQLLSRVQAQLGEFPSEKNAAHYQALMKAAFKAFPDDLESMRTLGLAYFRYFVTPDGSAGLDQERPNDLEALIKAGHIKYAPITYEDFLPVSAAGIFQSNLGDVAQIRYNLSSSQAEFHEALGSTVQDELKLYADTQARSLENCARKMNLSFL